MSCIAEKYDFEFCQGSTFKWDISVKDPDDIYTAFPLNGYTPTAMARTNYSDALPAFTFTCAVTSNANGTIRISLTDIQTAAIAKGRYYYDVELTSLELEVIKLYRGSVAVLPEATK